MNNQLQNTLRTLIKSGWQSNPAMHIIINDYAKYHAALVIVGGLFTLVLISLNVVFWIKFNKIPKTGKFKWTFEKKVYLSFGLLSGIVALFLGFIVAVNATTTFNPLHGFTLLIDELTTSSHSAQLHQAYNDWIQSGSINLPSLIEQRIKRRVTFHSTKAIVCSILLIVFTAPSIYLWSTLIERCNASKTKWRLKEKTFFVAGIATVAFSLLMMIMIVANLHSCGCTHSIDVAFWLNTRRLTLST